MILSIYHDLPSRRSRPGWHGRKWARQAGWISLVIARMVARLSLPYGNVFVIST